MLSTRRTRRKLRLRQPTFAGMRLPSPISSTEIAQRSGAEHHGPEAVVHGLNEIHRVQTGDLTFVDHPKYYRKTLSSAASVVLINRLPDDLASLTEGQTPTLLIHPRPFDVYDDLVREYRPPYVLSATVAPSAVVHPSAVLEPGVVLGPNVYVGARSVIGANAVVYGPTKIGSNARIGAGCIIGELAFYFQTRSQPADQTDRPLRRRWATGGEVSIGNHADIGAQCVVARGVSSTTRIGDGCKLDAACMIGHGAVLGRDCLLAAHVGMAGKSSLGERVVLYGQTGVAQNCHVGDDAVCLGRTGVSKSIPGGKVYNGYPVQEAREWLHDIARLRRMAREQVSR